VQTKPDNPEVTSGGDGVGLGFCSPERPDPGTLVFIACAECGSVVTLADSVTSVTAQRVCWGCALLSLQRG
jgi:hypothetical protein